jgi:hypothetical protein
MPAVLLILGALVLPAALLRADAGTDVRKVLLAATVRAIELEIEAAKRKLKAAEAGTGPRQNVERFRQKVRGLEAEQARFGRLKPGKKYRLQLGLVYRREYFGLIGDYYVYVMSVR